MVRILIHLKDICCWLDMKIKENIKKTKIDGLILVIGKREDF